MSNEQYFHVATKEYSDGNVDPFNYGCSQTHNSILEANGGVYSFKAVRGNKVNASYRHSQKKYAKWFKIDVPCCFRCGWRRYRILDPASADDVPILGRVLEFGGEFYRILGVHAKTCSEYG